jgi:hypothetical protein
MKIERKCLKKTMGGSMDYWFPVTRSNIGEGIEKEAKKRKKISNYQSDDDNMDNNFLDDGANSMAFKASHLL